MEIKDNTEHLSLSQSRSNMKQFNKQLQAVPREMMERLGPRGRTGRLQTARCGFSTRASRWCLATVLWWKMTHRQNQNNGPVQGFLVVCPPEIYLSRTRCKQQGGDQEGCSGELLTFVQGNVCVCGCLVRFLLDSHGPCKEECTKALKICKKSKLVAFLFYI